MLVTYLLLYLGVWAAKGVGGLLGKHLTEVHMLAGLMTSFQVCTHAGKTAGLQ